MIAAGVAFYGLLAIFPAITALVSIWGLVADPAQVQQQFAAVGQIVPADAWRLLDDQLRSVAASSPRALGWGVALGILVALWSAGAGVRALITALNIAYGEAEKRGFITLYAIGFLLTLGLIGAAVLALIVIVAVPVVLQFLPLGSLSSAVIRVLTWLIMAGDRDRRSGGPLSLRPEPEPCPAALGHLGGDRSRHPLVAGVVGVSGLRRQLRQLQRDLRLARRGDRLANVVLDLGLRSRPARRRAQCGDGAPDRKDTTTGPAKPLGQRDAYVADHVGEVP